MYAIQCITRKETQSHIKRNVITRKLGTDESEGLIEATITAEEKIEDGDVFLLCSDGLSDMLDDEMIAAICSNKKGATFAKELCEAAIEAGGQDNIKIVVVTVKNKNR